MAKEEKTKKVEETKKGKKVELKDLRAKKNPKGGMNKTDLIDAIAKRAAR